MMLDYEWGNPAAAAAAAMLLFGDEGEQAAAGRAPVPSLGEYYGGNPGFFAPPVQHLTAAALFSGAPVTAAGGQRYGMGMPAAVAGGGGRMGLNLGVRTYFSSVAAAAAAQEEMVMTGRVCRRRVRTARCQAEGCGADLTHAKHYHRRHKVCEFHSKASIVIAAGLSQRFCQQCSRFHVLSEFDQGKRSCRKRLADHNRRRRKSQDLTAATISSSSAAAAAAIADDSINYSAKQQLIVRDQFDASSSSNNNCIPETGGSIVTRGASPPPSVPAMALALGCGGFALSPAGLSGSSSTVTSPPRIPFFSHLGDFRGGHEHRFLGWDDGDDGSSIRSLYDQTK